ncbi:MAG: MogA/MoaB family molybdenum cofactor biosynthesis protein [Dehalococcoidia bacterium]|nr:MogA/MoaB family molybdenum cofactor biosynthesis protein [Dehalococcoidia bacterium]
MTFTVGILTVSDKCSQGLREDLSGEAIREIISGSGGHVVDYAVVPDEKGMISSKLADWADRNGVDVIITTGGTGLGPRDVTPEATLAVVDRIIPGLPEAIRAFSLKKTPHAMLSRETSGSRKKTLIVNLPGSPRAVRESLPVILPALPHAVEVLKGEAGECARPEESQP